MSTAVSPASRAEIELGEKEFYLDEFRAHTLCLAATLADCERPGGFETLGRVARELIGNETRLIVLLGIGESEDVRSCLRRLRARFQRRVLSDETRRYFPAAGGHSPLRDSVRDFTGPTAGDALDAKLESVWQTLRGRPLLVAAARERDLILLAQTLAGRLRVHKLVLIEPAGGISSPAGEHLSFLDDAMLTAVLLAGQAEWSGLAARRETLCAVQEALRGGVHSVNLCSLDGLERELYTYEGSGTLFTLEDYCRIERLGIDDFEEVERLIARGQREGYLKVRTPAEMAHLLFNGYGATIGAHHLAGVCGLEIEPYRGENAGEIVALYTITRFKGEGVGGRLVARVLADARADGLAYVFACTTEPRAQAFFERQGFRNVTPDAVPRAKWIGYDPARLARLQILRFDL
jgi:N-acetylglutamate synthase-like GNAT family acetyltransferase